MPYGFMASSCPCPCSVGEEGERRRDKGTEGFFVPLFLQKETVQMMAFKISAPAFKFRANNIAKRMYRIK